MTIAPCYVSRASPAPSPMSGPPFRIDEGAQIVEAVGGEESRRHQFPECSFDFGFEFAGSAHNVGEERGTPPPDELQHLPRDLAERLGRHRERGVARNHPIGFFPHEECDRSHARRNDATRCRRVREIAPSRGLGRAVYRFEGRRMR